MKKTICGIFVLVLSLFMFSGCTASELKTLGTAFVEDAFAQDYNKLSEQMESSFKQNFTEETMNEMVTSVTSQYGDFDAVISANVGNDPDYPDYRIVTVNTSFADGKMQFKLAYDIEKQLCGISLLASEEKASSSQEPKDYRIQAKEFWGDIFNGDTASAYELLSERAKESYTQENLEVLKTEAENASGAFIGIGPTRQEEYVVTTYLEFEEGESTVTLDFDADGLIADISVIPAAN